MEPAAAAWITFAIGFLLWALGDADPVQVSLPYIPEPKGNCRDTEREYYNVQIQRCCNKCPPGQRVLHFCTRDSNTVCTDCEPNLYTEVWNWIKACHGCRGRCNRDLVEIENCTKSGDRICACKPGFFCVVKSQKSCVICSKFKKCLQGFGVSKPGTSDSNVQCASCEPGTFSDTVSSTDVCKPHRVCRSVAVPGNATSDAICTDMVPAPPKTDPPLSKSQPGFMNPKDTMWNSQPNITLGTSPQPQPQPTVSLVFSNGSVLPLGWILGLMIVVLLLIGLVFRFTLSQRKKKLLSCVKEETKVPNSAAEKSQNFLGHTGTEQQNLLDSEATSSSNSLDSMLSSEEAKEFHEAKGMENNPHQAPSSESSKSGQGTRIGSMNSEHAHSGGTQVKVTCIVNVCNSDHTSQCSSQSSCSDFEASSSGSPLKEDIPFSQEESPRKGKPSSQSALNTLLPYLEEKPLPIGIQDMGMKLS
ncbi:tumor necrosis factor receptor superfamily member 1B-like [Trichosurus vulpecula]|uniref:tumor necrosis factor receptor superfamily member 1B-like n=1 Tax=Trichosurus vulpecula TaxID=9337 RepID=UPI00186AC17E|nr:tumor necrosis factor receptor superfamily member 1B-like [Trichosurus vulpecula]